MTTTFENEAAVKSVVLAHTKFAFNLYKELAAVEDAGNFVLSPLAVSAGLAALYRGAHEETALQLKHALKLDIINLEDPDVHAAYRELLEFVLQQSPSCNYILQAGLFSQEGFPLEEDFAESMSEQYQVHTQALDFGDDEEAACTEIKQWAENATAGQLKNIISEVSPDTLLLFLNVALYKGHWLRKFDSKNKKDFRTLSGEKVKTSFLGSTADFNFAALDDLDADAVAIPYVDNAVSLIVVLPRDAGGLVATEEAMSGDDIEEVISTMQSKRMRVDIPKFRLDSSLDLEDALRKLDVNDLFSLGEADLSGVDGTEALYVSRFVHRSVVEVAEEGEVGEGGGGGGQADGEFIANHPFLYFIRDNRTESILMMGRYTSPPPRNLDDLGTRMGMSVKNAFKRMSSKEPEPTSPTSPQRNSSSTSSFSSTTQPATKKQAPPPPPPSNPQPEVVSTPPPAGTASYGATEQQAQVNPTSPTSPTSPNAPPKKKKSHSSLFFCCVKGSANDLDFDSM